jgi:hypothetical protein
MANEQGGCAICHRPEPGKKGWVVDHDHSCCPGDRSCPLCRRGILCQWCNNALGYALDNPATLRAMADYLESQVRLATGYPLATPTDRQTSQTDTEVGDMANPVTDCNVHARTRISTKVDSA